MKNKHYRSFLFPLLFAYLAISCIEDKNDVIYGNVNKDEYFAAIEKSKAIFADFKSGTPIIKVRSSNESSMVIDFMPVWEEALVYNHKNSSTTVETNILMSSPIHLLTQDSKIIFDRSGDLRYQQYLSRAVVQIPYGENSSPNVFLMTIIGSKHYLETHNFSLSDVSYMNVPEDFSGLILYYTLSGDYINGWYVDEGLKYRTCTQVPDNDVSFTDTVKTRSKIACEIMPIYKYYYTCRQNGNNIFKTYESRSLNSTSYLCTGPSIKAENIRICSLVDNSYFSPGDVGTVIPFVDLSLLFETYSPALYVQLQGFMDYIENHDEVSKAILDYIEYINTESVGVFQRLNVMLDTSQTANVRYYSPSNTVYFKSEEVYSDRALYEELIHALQRVIYSDYDEIPFNIEFEAQLIMDYMCFVDGEEGYTEMALNMKYAQAGLKNGQTLTLSEWIRSNAYSNIDIDDFRQYLILWKTIPAEYQNYIMSPRVQPKLLPAIINKINNNKF